MKNQTELTARVERLERQNSLLKVVVLLGIAVALFSYVTDFTDAKDKELSATRFKIISPDGKNCGYLGYDTGTKNPRLSLKQCADGVPEMIGLMIDKDSPLLKLDALGYPTAILQTDRQNGNALLQLNSQNGTPENPATLASISSGNIQSPPQIILQGSKKGRISFFENSDYLRIEDQGAKKRFAINKNPSDSILLNFFDQTGTSKTYQVPPTP